MTEIKKIFIMKICAVVFAVVALVLAAASLVPAGRSFESASNATPQTESAFTSEQMRAELKTYLDGRDDRTPYSEGEKEAANYLFDEMSALPGFETEKQEVRYQPYTNSDQIVYYSQNIVSVRKSAKPNAKTVIIGANYDNQYGELVLPATSKYSADLVLLNATRSVGAYFNGTGTATLLSLARKLARDEAELDFDLYIVFFGCGEYGSYGARAFVDDFLTASLYSKTVLMIELQHLGGDHTYIYCDEVRTDHRDYLFKKAFESGMQLKSVPVTLPRMTDSKYVDGIGYVHMGMLGGCSAFMSRGIPVANIFGGTFDTLSFGLAETRGKSTIVYTENDNLDYLENNLPGYADKMAETATLVYNAFTSPDFISSIENSRETKEDYSLLMKGWIPALIAIGTLLLCALALIPIARYFEKKYPPRPKTVRKLKMAVFGMDYEDPTSGDIFVDLKRKDPSDDNSPFSGY